MRLETGFDVMEMVANSSSDRRQVGRQKDPQRSSVTHGSKPSHFRLRVTRRDQQDFLLSLHCRRQSVKGTREIGDVLKRGLADRVGESARLREIETE